MVTLSRIGRYNVHQRQKLALQWIGSQATRQFIILEVRKRWKIGEQLVNMFPSYMFPTVMLLLVKIQSVVLKFTIATPIPLIHSQLYHKALNHARSPPCQLC